MAPVVSKTAELSARRDVSWRVVKSANASKAGWDAKDGTVAVAYRVEVNRGLGPVHTVRVNGSISIQNPNQVPITVTDIQDSLPGGVCTSGGGSPGSVVDPGKFLVRTYICTLAGKPAGPLTNTVQVAWEHDGWPGTSSRRPPRWSSVSRC